MLFVYLTIFKYVVSFCFINGYDFTLFNMLLYFSKKIQLLLFIVTVVSHLGPLRRVDCLYHIQVSTSKVATVQLYTACDM